MCRGARTRRFSSLVIDPRAGRRGQRKTRGLDPVICATLSDAGFLPQTLDAAGLFDVVEHIADDREFLASHVGC